MHKWGFGGCCALLCDEGHSTPLETPWHRLLGSSRHLPCAQTRDREEEEEVKEKEEEKGEGRKRGGKERG